MKEILQFLHGVSGGCYHEKIEEKLFEYAWQSYRVLRYTLILVSCGVIVYIFQWWRKTEQSLKKKEYFLLYLSLVGVTILFTIWDMAGIKRGIKNKRAYLSAGSVYAMLVALWGSAVSALDYVNGQGYIVYILTLLIISVSVILKPWQSVGIFSGSCLVLNIFINQMGNQAEGYLNIYASDLFILSVIASVISIFFYISRYKNIMNQLIIEEQNKKLQEMNEQLKKEIIIDSLTGLYNRRFLADVVSARFNECAAISMAVACIMIDIDLFKKYNDNFGHQKGDECLTSVADTIKKCFKQEEAKAIRYGGEEFLVFLMGCKRERAFSQAERLREAIVKKRLERCDVALGRVTVSVGVYGEKLNAKSQLKDMIRCADTALYQAKREGRNCVRMFEER